MEERFYIKEVKKFEKEMENQEKEKRTNIFMLSLSVLGTIAAVAVSNKFSKNNEMIEYVTALVASLGMAGYSAFLVNTIIKNFARKTSLEHTIEDILLQMHQNNAVDTVEKAKL